MFYVYILRPLKRPRKGGDTDETTFPCSWATRRRTKSTVHTRFGSRYGHTDTGTWNSCGSRSPGLDAIVYQQRSYKIKRILVVEDEPAISELCRRVLTNEGLEIDIAVDGKLAQGMLDEKDYELCLIDIRTPIMNGKQLYQVIVEKHKKLVGGVIFTTADTMDEDIKHFLEVAGRPFLPKPFTPDELKTIVQETLRQIAK
jgi:CheY-like chemotaxis protein